MSGANTVHQLTIDFPMSRRDGRVVHMCLNSNCFYCETIMSVNDLVWKEIWDHSLESIEMIPHCPSCGEVIWREME